MPCCPDDGRGDMLKGRVHVMAVFLFASSPGGGSLPRIGLKICTVGGRCGGEVLKKGRGRRCVSVSACVFAAP